MYPARLDDKGRLKLPAVFQQFFDNAGRPLDHFAGGNAIDNLSVKLLDAWHGGGAVYEDNCRRPRC